MSNVRTTLNQFLIETSRWHSGVTESLSTLIGDLSVVCRSIAERVGSGALADLAGPAGSTNVQGELRQKLDILANESLVRATASSRAGMASEEMATPFAIPPSCRKDRYLLIFDPLDGASNIGVNGPVGSIFSILQSSKPDSDVPATDYLQPGVQQVGAGYAIYGPSTMFVIAVGAGVQGFTLDRRCGEFILTHPSLHIPSTADEFAIDASNSRFWEPAIKRYIGECIAGKAGPRQRDFNMRWVGSLVAEAHRILMRGGIFLSPGDTEEPPRDGRLRLLYEANPIAFIVEQAGGSASTGYERVLNLVPRSLHERVPFIFGARQEVELVASYHRENSDFDAPLFGSRGLFRASA